MGANKLKHSLHQLVNALCEEHENLPFSVTYWDGERIDYGHGQPLFAIHFKTPAGARRLFSAGSLGFGQSYMKGEIDLQGNLIQLFRLATGACFQNLKLSWRIKSAILFHNLMSLNSLRRAPRNIAQHYDRGNDFYRLWLDKSMTYSCAYFRKENDLLEKAQAQKYEHICRKLMLQRNESLVDIGCGWGGMLLYAARHYGIYGMGCTLSSPQVEWAQQQIKRARLQKRISVIQEDYRRLSGTFDKLVSIGMFEHVGKNYIDRFMAIVRKLLKPGGIGLLHTIGKDKEEAGDPWVRKYIFPGGYIPVLAEILEAMGKQGLVPLDVENLRLHYARTLEEWAKRYERNITQITAMFGEEFVRMWRMFLHASAAGFRYGTTRLYQITFSNGLNNALPWTREHIYHEAH